MALYGSAVAEPFALSVWSVRTISVFSLGRPADGRNEARVDRLGERRDVLRDLVLGRVVVDAEVLRLDRLPEQLRIVRACARRAASEARATRDDDERDEKSEAADRQAALSLADRASSQSRRGTCGSRLRM